MLAIKSFRELHSHASYWGTNIKYSKNFTDGD
jgi:hypothetical protein